MSRCAAVATLLIAVACNREVREAKKLVRAAVQVPQTQATVVTIRTSTQPGNKTTISTVVIGSDVARDATEVVTWRLFDLQNERVGFVNDAAKTVRWATLQDLEAQHPAAADDGAPHARLQPTRMQRPLLGVPAALGVVKLGGYERQVWIGSHPLIPAMLFPLMDASDGSREHVLTGVRGFPLADHSEVTAGKTKFVVDRQVVSVERKNVPAALLQIPSDYKEIKEPAVRRPAASSHPPDRRTPATGSRSSATVRTNP